MEQDPNPKRIAAPAEQNTGTGASFDYDALRGKIASALDGFMPRPPVSAASMAVDLRTAIMSVSARGGTWADVARIMTECGLPTTADAIRVALRRGTVTRVARTRKARATPALPKTPAAATGIGDPPAPSGSDRIDAPDTGLHLD